MPKITVTGPESTGKSTLALLLSKELEAGLVTEYAREYLSQLNRPYDESDLHTMALHQHEKEVEASENQDLLVCDTDLLTFVIWWEVKYGYCPERIVLLWLDHQPDLYLLCDIDLPWETDPLREHPDEREDLIQCYRNRLNQHEIPFEMVTGQGNARLENAMNHIAKVL